MYTVTWVPEALGELAGLLLEQEPDEATKMEDAVLALNARLAANPFGEGESRGGADRVTFAPPYFTVFVTVDAARRVVDVTHFRRR